MKEISEQAARDLLRARISYGVRITAIAEEFGVSVSFMSAVLNGKKRMTDKMLKSIGVERRVIYLLLKNPRKGSVPKTKPGSEEV